MGVSGDASRAASLGVSTRMTASWAAGQSQGPFEMTEFVFLKAAPRSAGSGALQNRPTGAAHGAVGVF
jgi:hypothetical protein